MVESESKYILRCIELAKKGGKAVKTNPLVGAVIVYKDNIIGEGYHEKFGSPHAEINAFNSVKIADRQYLSSATLYVSLEPCCTYGKTPPCTQKIIDSGIKKIVVGCLDPNPDVNGKGVEILNSFGISVEMSVLNIEAENLIRKFKANLQRKPYIVLKWAQSFDGYLGHRSKQYWLTNQASKNLVHKWRTEVDAILIGKNTALIDDPQLTTRLYDGENPTRIVLDKHLELPANLKILSDGYKTIILNEVKNEIIGPLQYIKLDDFSAQNIANTLFSNGIYSLILEGGKKVLSHFIDTGIWNEARVFKTTERLTNEYQPNDLITAPQCAGKLKEKRNLDGDELVVMYNVS